MRVDDRISRSAVIMAREIVSASFVKGLKLDLLILMQPHNRVDWPWTITANLLNR